MFRQTYMGAWATCALMLTHPAVAAANDIVASDILATDIILYASDVTRLHGDWRLSADATAADGAALVSANRRSPAGPPAAAPQDFFDLTFDAPAGATYRLWLRMRAAANAAGNDSVYVQYSDAITATGRAVHRIGTARALQIELADCRRCPVAGWGWQDDTWSKRQVTEVRFAASGTHTLRVQTREDGVIVDQILLRPTAAPATPPGAPTDDTTVLAKPLRPRAAAAPYLGLPTAIPGTIDPATFDEGGSGLGYRDTTAGNAGGTFRNTDVDIEPSVTGGYNIGWTADDEWLGYWVNVTDAGSYVLSVELATPLAGPALHVTVGSTTAQVPVPTTGGWQLWSTVKVPLSLSAGVQRLRVVFDTGGVNLGRLTFTPTTTVPPPPPPGTGLVGRQVGPADDLQAAIDAAAPGDTLLLTPGASYVGNFVLPVKQGAAYVTIRTNTVDASLPGSGMRITPTAAPLLAKIRSPNSMAAMTTAAGAHHYRFLFLEFQANVGGYGEVVSFGDGSKAQNTLASVPYALEIDRCYLHGDPIVGQKRGVGLNSASSTIANSHFADFKADGFDSQAIAGWNGPGPFTISNNYLEAAGENVLFGGGDPSIPDLVPSDITFTRNHLSRPLAWRHEAWDVKNLFELKNAQRVIIDGNVMENHWAGAQPGYAVVFTPRNQDGGAPWSVVQHVRFTNNVVRHVASGINILGRDSEHPSQLTNDIVIANNLFEHVSAAAFGGAGRFMLIAGGANITVDHNTVIQDGWSALYSDAHQTTGFVFTNNIVPDYSWAIMGVNASPGNGTIGAYFPNALFLGGIYAGANPGLYPPGNFYPPAMTGVGFVDQAGRNYRLAPTSPYRLAATDGTDVGCQIDTLNAATGAGY